MATKKKAVLLNNVGATGSYVQFEGGPAAFVVDAVGGFGAGSVTLQVKGPGGTAISLGAAITANGLVNHILPHGEYRALVAAGPANVYAELVPVEY